MPATEQLKAHTGQSLEEAPARVTVYGKDGTAVLLFPVDAREALREHPGLYSLTPPAPAAPAAPVIEAPVVKADATAGFGAFTSTTEKKGRGGK